MLFMGPPDKEKLWNEDGLAGMYKFLNRVWRQVDDLMGAAGDDTLFQVGATPETAQEALDSLVRERHRVVGKVQADIDRNNFNTAMAAIMELSNAVGAYLRAAGPAEREASEFSRAFDREVAEVLVKLLAPIAPFTGPRSCGTRCSATMILCTCSRGPISIPPRRPRPTVELAVQVNGKVKARIVVPADAPEDEVRAAGLAAVAADLEGKDVKKAIVVPGRLVNVVAK